MQALLETFVALGLAHLQAQAPDQGRTGCADQHAGYHVRGKVRTQDYATQCDGEGQKSCDAEQPAFVPAHPQLQSLCQRKSTGSMHAG